MSDEFCFYFQTLIMINIKSFGINIIRKVILEYQYSISVFLKYLYTDNSKGRATPMCCRKKRKQPIKKQIYYDISM